MGRASPRAPYHASGEALSLRSLGGRGALLGRPVVGGHASAHAGRRIEHEALHAQRADVALADAAAIGAAALRVAVVARVVDAAARPRTGEGGDATTEGGLDRGADPLAVHHLAGAERRAEH